MKHSPMNSDRGQYILHGGLEFYVRSTVIVLELSVVVANLLVPVSAFMQLP
jgi:hypothetical protein